uniref:(northern house mosquito) hypothetical protein n=1 Tax=Culex pipiens TaxID=7175 RepID=A0A8D8I545_CULPI
MNYPARWPSGPRCSRPSRSRSRTCSRTHRCAPFAATRSEIWACTCLRSCRESPNWHSFLSSPVAPSTRTAESVRRPSAPCPFTFCSHHSAAICATSRTRSRPFCESCGIRTWPPGSRQAGHSAT